jgi:hypothetical protein
MKRFENKTRVAMSIEKLSCRLVAVGAVITLGSYLLVFPVWSCAQESSIVYGKKAICKDTGDTLCSMQEPSSAAIDASAVSTTLTSTTICGRISAAYASLPGGGGVIDARGISGTTTLTCTSLETPWSYVTNPQPATILLPAGQIVTTTTWIIPNKTKIVGVGAGVQNLFGTVIAASSSSFSGAILQMGSSACSPCTGIGIENLTLNGAGSTSTGILNNAAGQRSYVNHVGLDAIRGTGLLVSGASAQNSGPYANIIFNIAGTDSSASTTCAQILNVSGTKGIHGLTCLSTDTNAAAAVMLDSSNNSIEDVLVHGFGDGIRIGSQGVALSNIVRNVTDTTPSTQDNATIHIASSSNAVTDLALIGINNSCQEVNNVPCHSYSIWDERTGTKFSDLSVGMYVIGQSSGTANIYTRFTTSPSVPTWVVGNPTVSSVPTGACAVGSLYSNTSGNATNGTLYACAPGGTGVWTKVK